MLNCFFPCLILPPKQQYICFMLDPLIAPSLFETLDSCRVVRNGEMKPKNLLYTEFDPGFSKSGGLE